MYGNLINRISENRCYKTDFVPNVGMGATEYMWSDRHAYSVCIVHKNWNKKGYEIIGLQRDYAERTDKNYMSDDQSYKYIPNINADICYLKSKIIDHEKLGKVKVYQPVRFNSKTNRWNQGGSNVVLGHRDAYFDYSF